MQELEDKVEESSQGKRKKRKTKKKSRIENRREKGWLNGSNSMSACLASVRP
jgi:hypothetical protein